MQEKRLLFLIFLLCVKFTTGFAQDSIISEKIIAQKILKMDSVVFADTNKLPVVFVLKEEIEKKEKEIRDSIIKHEKEIKSILKEMDSFVETHKNLLPADTLLKIKYLSYLNVDRALNFIPERFGYAVRVGPDVNPFVIENVYFKRRPVKKFMRVKMPVSLADLESRINKSRWDTLEFGPKNKREVFKKILSNTYGKPYLVNNMWRNMPDPPNLDNKNLLPTISEVVIDDEFDPGLIQVKAEVKTIAAKEKYWNIVGNASLFINQTGYTFWDKGASNTYSLLGIYVQDADYKKDNLIWDNNLEVKLGMMKKEEEKMQKNEDILRMSSKLGYKAFKNWYISANADFKSQFFDTYDYKKPNQKDPLSTFLSPAEFYFSLGMDYKKDKVFTIFASPLTYKLTYVLDSARVDPKRHGIKETGERSKQELGGYIKSQLNYKINRDIFLTSKLYLFSNYLLKPENVDIDWENILDFKVSRLLSARLGLHFKYDDDIDLEIGRDENNKPIYGKRLQFKEMFNIGFSYRF